jgi:predicted dinucleotide-binding enzyme
MTNSQRITRRDFLHGAGTAAAILVAGPAFAFEPLEASPQALRIGIIGSGQMGGAVGIKWAHAGHQVFFSSRNPDQLAGLVAEAGPNAQAGLPDAAARFGEVVVIAVPYGALPQVGQDYGLLMQGKVVIDLGNPREDRDGPVAADAIERGTGVASAGYLPGVRLVRALNAVSFREVQDAPRSPLRVGVPIAGDDREAVEVATRLVEDSGFEPVFVGGLARAREFDRGTSVYVRGLSAAEIRDALDL